MSASKAEILRIQRAFRASLNAMARPGTVAKMPLPPEGAPRYPGVSASLATLVDLFVDQATSVAVASGADGVAGERVAASGPDGAAGERADARKGERSDRHTALCQALAAETHARVKAVDEAAFVVVPETASEACVEEAVSKAMGGTFESPETGATVLIECGRLATDDEKFRSASPFALQEPCELVWVSVEGPGVKDSHTFGIDRIEWVWARNRREDEFPCGIDIILTDPTGRVVALPRTSFVSLRAGRGAE